MLIGSIWIRDICESRLAFSEPDLFLGALCSDVLGFARAVCWAV